MNQSLQTSSPLLEPRAALVALLVGAAGLLIWAIGLFFDREAALRSYLFAFVFINSIPLGCLALVMLHHLTGGVWGVPARRLAEAAGVTIPLMALLFIPIAIAIITGHLYPWARPEEFAHDAILRHRRELPVLGFSTGWVLARAAIYFAVWSILAWWLRGISLRKGGVRNIAGSISGAGTVLYFITVSLAASDWVMSREAHYYSSVFGFITVAAQSVAGLCFVIVILALLADRALLQGKSGPSGTPLNGPDVPKSQTVFWETVTRPRALHDLGNLLLTCVVMWAYVSFAQLLVNWVGNTQEDVTWYVHRSHGGWRIVTIAVIVLHFFVPFVLLLLQPTKRNLRPLARLAAGLLILRLIDVLWLIAPSSPTEHAGGLYWTDLFAPIGVGGIWLAGFLWILRRAPVVVPELLESMPPETEAGGGGEVSLRPS
jgi:hypothetical protein